MTYASWLATITYYTILCFLIHRYLVHTHFQITVISWKIQIQVLYVILCVSTHIIFHEKTLHRSIFKCLLTRYLNKTSYHVFKQNILQKKVYLATCGTNSLSEFILWILPRISSLKVKHSLIQWAKEGHRICTASGTSNPPQWWHRDVTSCLVCLMKYFISYLKPALKALTFRESA